MTAYAHKLELLVELADNPEPDGPMKLECGSCGAQYPSDLPKQWGRTEETNGYGPSVKCIAKVPTLAAVEEARRGNREINPATDPHEVCGGFLGAIPENAADASRLITLTLNGEESAR